MFTCKRKISIAISLLLGTAAGITLHPASASSHREAPFVTRMPAVDGTDFYMFRSYETGRSNYVTLIANYIPLEEQGAAPNYYAMDPNALYEIHIDNNGDAKEDLSFQFRFNDINNDNKLTIGGKQVSIPLVINGSTDINSPGSSALNRRETYSVTLVRGDRRSGTRQAVANADGGSATFEKPVDNIGNKSISDYAAYAAKHVYNINIPGCDAPGRMFVGQRKDPFVVNLGEIFDLINIKAPATAFDPNAEKAAQDVLANKNVTAIELEVPISCLTNGSEPVIGAWTTASVRQGRLINPNPGSGGPSKEGGAWTQVSRLGNPLVNEVVIGLKDKDRFNSSKPVNDAQFLDYVTNPTLPALVEVLFGNAGVKAPSNFPRNDLVTAFLTGVDGVNKPAKVTPSEMLRLNTSTPVSGTQNRLGVIAGDAAGFPNGRRPGDDIVDVALRVMMGRLCTLNIGCKPSDAPSGNIDFTDGAYLDSTYFDMGFPYLKTPLTNSQKQ